MVSASGGFGWVEERRTDWVGFLHEVLQLVLSGGNQLSSATTIRVGFMRVAMEQPYAYVYSTAVDAQSAFKAVHAHILRLFDNGTTHPDSVWTENNDRTEVQWRPVKRSLKPLVRPVRPLLPTKSKQKRIKIGLAADSLFAAFLSRRLE